MSPMEQTASDYVRTATHPTYRWEFTYLMKDGLVMQLHIHHSENPEYFSLVADYLAAIQQGLQHLLLRELLPEGLAKDKNGIETQLIHHINLARPDLIVQYRLMAKIWAEALCVQTAVALHASSTVPVAPDLPAAPDQ